MFFIEYIVKEHMFAGRVKIVNHSSCRTSTRLKYFLSPETCSNFGHFIFRLFEASRVMLTEVLPDQNFQDFMTAIAGNDEALEVMEYILQGFMQQQNCKCRIMLTLFRIFCFILLLSAYVLK